MRANPNSHHVNDEIADADQMNSRVYRAKDIPQNPKHIYNK